MTKINEMTTQLELAPSPREFFPADPETFKKTYKELNDVVTDKARLIVGACKSLNSRWAELLPTLDQMQSFLSQRGDARGMLREAKLPTWSEWWKSFESASGLYASLRTMQKHLSKYRSTGQEKQRRSDPPVRLSSSDQRRALRALQCANEMVEAFNNHRDPVAPLREYNRIAIGADRIGEMLENIPADAEPFLVSRASAAPADRAAVLVADQIAIPQEQIPRPNPIKMPEPGDRSGLFNMVNDTCGTQIRAALMGLPPDLMANVFGEFVRKLANMHCQYDREAGELKVAVEYFPNRPSALGRAA
jgi:hypothetical protein